MQVKTYRVHKLKQAYDAAIADLGPEALYVTDKKVRQKGFFGFFKKRVLEVTFCYDEGTAPSSKPSKKKKLELDFNYALSNPGGAGQSGLTGQSPGTGMSITPGTGSNPYPSKDQAEDAYNEKLESRMDELASTLTSFMDKFEIVKRDITYDYPEEVEVLLGKLLDQQVREELAHTLAKQTEKLMREKPGTAATEILEHLLQEQFGKAAPVMHKKFTQKVILVLGPTGVGKTTTIVKLAAIFFKQRKNVGIINTDAYRIGAQEQLQTYADILGVPFTKVYYPDELTKAMEEMADRDIIFVDTAGKRPGDEEYKEDLTKMIKILKPEDILLCLASTTSFSSIREMVDTYGFIDDYRLMITKLDETKYRGSLLNISWYTHKPLAYVTTGQEVPDDIEVANIEKIVKELLE